MKILDALRRRVVRLIGPADTSVPPKSGLPLGMTSDQFVNHLMQGGPQNPNIGNPSLLADAILKSLQEQGIIPAGMTPRITVMRQGPNGEIEPITSLQAPPPIPGIQPPADMAFAQWRQMMAETPAPAGWASCRFGNHGVSGNVRWVFGVARGYFGLYRHPFECCLHDDDETDERVERVLTAITHLPTGLGMGLFEHLADAAAAVDQMDLVVKDWATVDVDNPNGPNGYFTAQRRVETAWEFAGFGAADFHAHDQASPPLAVWTRKPAGPDPLKPWSSLS